MDSGGIRPKEEWRREILARRRSLPAEVRQTEASLLSLHLMAEPVVARAGRVGVYLALPDEPDTSEFIDSLLARGVDVVAPVVVSDEEFVWSVLTSRSSVRTGAFGIDEPETWVVESRAPDVVVAPALAVDHRGTRLGRGAGYFDRALRDLDAPIVAVVRNDEIVPELPREAHDVPVNLVVAPSGTFRPQAF